MPCCTMCAASARSHCPPGSVPTERPVNSRSITGVSPSCCRYAQCLRQTEGRLRAKSPTENHACGRSQARSHGLGRRASQAATGGQGTASPPPGCRPTSRSRHDTTRCPRQCKRTRDVLAMCSQCPDGVCRMVRMDQVADALRQPYSKGMQLCRLR
jgi:hypothetical protein